MIIYNFCEEELAWWNVVIIVPIALYFMFFSIKQSRELLYLNKQGIVVPDRVKHIVGIIMAVVISIIMLSSTFNTFSTPFKYSKLIENEDYYIVQGQPEKVESYIHKTGGSEGIELLITLDGIEFDTGLSYGEANKFKKQDFYSVKNETVKIKYIYEKTGTYLHPVILEISVLNSTSVS